MKFLVTGGAGFIGSHLVEELVKNHHKVICVDDLSTGKLEYLTTSSNISFINNQIQNCNINDFPKGINGIFHLGAQPSVPLSIENLYSSSANNILSSLWVFNYAKSQKIPVVYASSSAVYGNLPIGNDQVKKYDILSPYAQDKLTLEHYAKICWELYKIPSIGLRFFNVYGPRQDPSNPYSGVISIFIDRLLKNKPVQLNGGYQTRDFIYVKDVASFISKSMILLYEERISDVFNIGTGISVSISQLLDHLRKITRADVKVVQKKLPKGDPEKSAGTYEKMENYLNVNLSQCTKLIDGLISTVDFIKMDMNDEKI